MKSHLLESSDVDVALASSLNVLISGPTGSGKSRLARDLHQRSQQKHGPFIEVNLASLHEGTFEATLFGHARGAFTGAQGAFEGLIRGAEKGTLFLDEVSELPLHLQARLLQVLQEKRLRPLGSTQEFAVNFRLVCATNCDLRERVRKGLFRQDLFYRICVISLRTHALADAEEGLDSICHDLLAEISREQNKPLKSLSPEFALALETHTWPGNVRELRSVLEVAVTRCAGDRLELEHLPLSFRESHSSAFEGPLGPKHPTESLPVYLGRVEKEVIAQALARNRWRMNQTARDLGLNKSTFLRRVREHGLTGTAKQACKSRQSPWETVA